MTLEQILAGSFIPWPVILFFGYMCFIWLLDLYYYKPEREDNE